MRQIRLMLCSLKLQKFYLTNFIFMTSYEQALHDLRLIASTGNPEAFEDALDRYEPVYGAQIADEALNNNLFTI